MKDYLKTHWREPYGDRQQELVFIGINQEQARMIEMLDSMLLTDEEFELGHEVWTTDKARFEDRFPEEFSDQLRKKHLHIMSSDQDK